MEKRLWRDVIKTAYGNTSNLASSSLRTVQQYYAKLLLPYECHLNNVDISTCLAKLDNSISRHTSLSSPCSQVSSDGESKDRVNHISKFDSGTTNSVEGRVNGETMDSVSSPNLLDGEHVVKRVSSQQPGSFSSSGGGGTGAGAGAGGGNGLHLSNSSGKGGGGGNGGGSTDPSCPPTAPQRGVALSAQERSSHMVNSQNHEDDQIRFSEDSDSYAQAEPLPEMSVQDAESVLGMSPMPYMPTQEGPSTPSAGVPSPNPFPSAHYQQQHGSGTTPTIHPPMTPGSVGTPTGPPGGGRGGTGGGGGSQEYSNVEMNEMGGASTPGMSGGGGGSGVPSASITPPAYPPPYPAMDMSGYHPASYSPGNYPPYNNSSFHRQYDVPPDFPPGMASSMMRLPFPSSHGPYAGIPPHRTPMDYHGHAYHPHMVHHAMGGMRDPSMYPGGLHGMSPGEWHWQQQQQQRQQQQQHIQRLQQQQQAINVMRQQQAALAAMQQSSNRSSPGLPPHSGGSPSMDPGGKGSGSNQWQDQNHPHKGLPSKVHHHSERLIASSPKPMPKHHEPSALEKAALSKAHHHHHEPSSVAAQLAAEAHKRSHPDWSNCVEGTKPLLVKRRRLYGFNCGEWVAMAV